jgi:dCTP deaminase
VELFPELVEREIGKGILPSQDIRDFRTRGHIYAPGGSIADDQIQPASVDLRLGPVAYRVRASFLPGRSSTILNKAKELLVAEVDLTKPSAALFEPSSVFIVPLMERLHLPSDVLGVANPKSTTGRLDILTRLITEYGDQFDQVARGYSGELFVEIVSRTFPVYVRAGMKLNQLRFVRGNPAPTGDRPLQERAREDALVYDEETPALASIDRGLEITVDLQGNGSDIVAYKAKRHAPVIELDKINHYEMDDFWEIIRRPNNDRYILEPSSFYLLTSRQKVRVPPDQAAEMVPYDPTMGEFRLHYAGFFDPGFGYGNQGEIHGTKAVLEVRAYEIPVLLEHDQLVGKLNYYRMAKNPDKVYGPSIGSSYQQQELTPSKQFKAPRRTTNHALPLASSAKV